MDVIGELLRAGLLGELGADGERAEKLRAAASGVSARILAERRGETSRAFLDALNERGGETTSLLRLAESELLAQWETLPNAFPETPTAIFRAVLLAGVAEAATSDSAVRSAGWYAVRNIRQFKPRSRWSDVAEALFNEWDGPVQQEIEDAWLPGPVSGALRMPTVPQSNQQPYVAASGLRERAVATRDSPDYSQFASTLQSEFTDYVDELLAATNDVGKKALAESGAQLKATLSMLGTKLRETLAAHEQVVRSTRLRTDLLWWRQSGYSARLGKRYSNLESARDVAVGAAFDLYAVVTPIAPLAVEALLAELVLDSTDDEAGLTPAELRSSARAAGLPAELLEHGIMLATPQDPASPELSLILSDVNISVDDAAVALFRDFQATRLLLGNGSPTEATR